MTRNELYREIKRIDGFIEVLQGFLIYPICKCVSQVDKIEEKFKQENKEQLQALINIRNFLIPLKGEPDTTLAKVHYNPVQFTC